MKEFLKRIKLNVILSALFTIALGVILIMYPNETITYASMAVGVLLVLMGGIGFISTLISAEHGQLFLIGNALVIILGLWIVLAPKSFASLLPIFMGVVLIIHAIQDFQIAAETRQYEYTGWVGLVCIGVICTLLGIVCIAYAFEIVTFSTILIGISLIFDGITDFYVVLQANRYGRKFRNAQKNAEAIDVEYHEVIDSNSEDNPSDNTPN